MLLVFLGMNDLRLVGRRLDIGSLLVDLSSPAVSDSLNCRRPGRSPASSTASRNRSAPQLNAGRSQLGPVNVRTVRMTTPTSELTTRYSHRTPAPPARISSPEYSASFPFVATVSVP